MINLPLEIARQVAAGQQPSAGESGSEVTGSLPPAAGATPSAMPPSPLPAVPVKPPATAPEHPADNLPGALGPHLRAAALKGEAAAQFEIAVRFAEGRVVPQNFSSAAEWFERAAKKGLAPAQFRLAGLYEKGLGVNKNLDTARRYYATAGEVGHAKALHNLAVLYAEGIDGKPDYQTAAKWFRKAAGYGVVDSQFNLRFFMPAGLVSSRTWRRLTNGSYSPRGRAIRNPRASATIWRRGLTGIRCKQPCRRRRHSLRSSNRKQPCT